MPARQKAPERTAPLRREEKKLRTRQEVLRAALAVFREHGFDAASTADIARRAGVSHGAVFTVAPTKEKLAAAAFEDEVRSVGELAFARAFAGKGDLVNRMAELFTTLHDFYEENHQVARVLLREMMLPDPAREGGTDNRLLADYSAGLRMLLQTAVQRRETPEGADIEGLTLALLGVYLVFLLARLNRTFADRDEHLAKCRQSLAAVLRLPAIARK